MVLPNSASQGSSEDELRPLILAYQADPLSETAADALMTVALPRIQKTSVAIVSRGFCPAHKDKHSFADDVCSTACVKLLSGFLAFRFEQSIQGFINRVVESAAIEEIRRDTGRSKSGPRKYTSLDAPVSSTDHRPRGEELIDPVEAEVGRRLAEERERQRLCGDLLALHMKQSDRAAFSGIVVRYYSEGLTHKRIAEKVGRSPENVSDIVRSDCADMKVLLKESYGIEFKRQI